MTFGSGPSVPHLREPEGQLLALAPGAERERGSKADKGKGLQGFVTFILVIKVTCVSNIVWATERDEAQKGIIT